MHGKKPQNELYVLIGLETMAYFEITTMSQKVAGRNYTHTCTNKPHKITWRLQVGVIFRCLNQLNHYQVLGKFNKYFAIISTCINLHCH